MRVGTSIPTQLPGGACPPGWPHVFWSSRPSRSPCLTARARSWAPSFSWSQRLRAFTTEPAGGAYRTTRSAGPQDQSAATRPTGWRSPATTQPARLGRVRALQHDRSCSRRGGADRPRPGRPAPQPTPATPGHPARTVCSPENPAGWPYSEHPDRPRRGHSPASPAATRTDTSHWDTRAERTHESPTGKLAITSIYSGEPQTPTVPAGHLSLRVSVRNRADASTQPTPPDAAVEHHHRTAPSRRRACPHRDLHWRTREELVDPTTAAS